jgi:hypothetical protein
MLIGMMDVTRDNGTSETMYIAVEEDGLTSRLPINQVAVEWRYDPVAGGWEDLNPQGQDDETGAD